MTHAGPNDRHGLMMKALSRLFAHYKVYHLHGPLMLKYVSILGFAGFPLLYLLRFTKSTPTYDDLAIRIVDATLCLILFLKDRWPERLKPYYLPYSYVVLIVTLPLTFVFTSLKQGGGMIALGNTLMAASFIILLADWRNMIVILVTGFGLASLLYVVTEPNPRIPLEYVMRFPILLVVVIGGSLFKFAAERATAERVRNAYASLAGSIAHEMRNPLGQLRYSLKSMQEALPPPSLTAQPQMLAHYQVETLYRYLAQSEIAVKRGLQVIEMTLDEVSAKPLDTSGFAYLSAAEATGKAVQEYGYESEEARGKVSVKVVEDFTFRGDETAYMFLVFNLLKNALYYLPFYPEARVIITVDRNKVSVRDSGPGIAPDVLANLFEPFRSVGKSGGTGLGLAYCQRVMRAFGGQIACESVLGEFTQFTMNFPPISQADGQAHRLAVLGAAQAAFRGKRLLVVDDDPTLRLTTRHKLQPLGAAIDEAPDGQRAMDMLARQRYDLVVLDLNMPVLDGYAVTERIRQGLVPANRDVCIVAYTSELAHVASVKTFKAGMDGFVSKPCAQLPLVQALHQALEHPLTRARTEAAVLAGRTVLLADDNPYNRKAVAAYLRHAGMKVVEADHGSAVLELLKGQDGWDAILMDINMPGMNGLETSRAIRAGTGASRNVPIIALTAHSDNATSAAARAAGMNDFITKPVDAPLLYEKLGRFVRQSSSVPGLEAVAVTSVKPPAPAGGAGSVLLDAHRLEGFRHIGMLEELINDYLPEIASLVGRLEESVARQDLPESIEILHSLLGMSGEAGAMALYQLVRRVYIPMVEERHWPMDSDWLVQLKTLAGQTGEALRAYGATDPRTSSI